MSSKKSLDGNLDLITGCRLFFYRNQSLIADSARTSNRQGLLFFRIQSELLARIRTSLRHSNRMASNSPLFIRPYKCQGLMLDFEKRMVTLDGKEIHLTPVEYKIVAYLSKNSGKVMTYASVMENVWGPFTDSNNRILRVNMANIRRKIERNPSQPQFLFTEVGVGYRMCEDENEM